MLRTVSGIFSVALFSKLAPCSFGALSVLFKTLSVFHERLAL